MDLRLNGRIALITAPSRGLGRAVAEELTAEGARVVISSRDAPAPETVAAEIRTGTGSEVTPIAADLQDPRQVERLSGIEPGPGSRVADIDSATDRPRFSPDGCGQGFQPAPHRSRSSPDRGGSAGFHHTPSRAEDVVATQVPHG